MIKLSAILLLCISLSACGLFGSGSNSSTNHYVPNYTPTY